MKVSVYKTDGGEISVLVEATPGKGRAPMLLRGITGENVVATILPIVKAMRRPKGAEQLELM